MDRDTAEPSVTSLPGDRAKRWVEYHHEVSAPSTYVYEFVLDASGPASGPFCTDIDGNVLMDFTCHVASAPLGYNNPKITEFLDDIGLEDPLRIAGQDFYVSGGWPPESPGGPGPTQLMHRLVETTEQYGLDRVFLSNTGAEAVENAIKICYNDGGHRAVTFEKAFHGRTLGALSLNRSKRVHRKGYPEIPGVISVPYCSCSGDCTCGWETDGPGGNVLADRLDPAQGNLDPEEVAYIILEPVQGEGGYRVPAASFVDDLKHILETYDIRLVADEIQSGLGRTGKMWAIEHTDLKPDVIASAKGLRVGATIASESLFPEETGRISSTWGAGDILGTMRGVAVLDAIEGYDLLANVTERGRQFREQLEDADLPGVTNVRGLGLMLAIDFESKDRRDAVVDAAFDRGLLVLGCGYQTLRVLPPLDVTEREIDLAVDLLTESINASA